MALTARKLANRAGQLCRNVAVLLIAGVWRKTSAQDVSTAIRRRPVHQQIAITAGVLAALFCFSLLAAQFGWVGILLFWLAVILLVN